MAKLLNHRGYDIGKMPNGAHLHLGGIKGAMHTGTTPPQRPDVGDLWWSTHDNKLWVHTDKGTWALQGSMPQGASPLQVPPGLKEAVENSCNRCDSKLVSFRERELKLCKDHVPNLDEVFTMSEREVLDHKYVREHVIVGLVHHIKTLEETVIELQNQIDELREDKK